MVFLSWSIFRRSGEPCGRLFWPYHELYALYSPDFECRVYPGSQRTGGSRLRQRRQLVSHLSQDFAALVAPAMASLPCGLQIHAMRSLTVPMFLSTHGNDVLTVLVWTYWESNMVESV